MDEVVGQSRLLAPAGEDVRLPVAHMVRSALLGCRLLPFAMANCAGSLRRWRRSSSDAPHVCAGVQSESSHWRRAQPHDVQVMLRLRNDLNDILCVQILAAVLLKRLGTHVLNGPAQCATGRWRRCSTSLDMRFSTCSRRNERVSSPASAASSGCDSDAACCGRCLCMKRAAKCAAQRPAATAGDAHQLMLRFRTLWSFRANLWRIGERLHGPAMPFSGVDAMPAAHRNSATHALYGIQIQQVYDLLNSARDAGVTTVRH